MRAPTFGERDIRARPLVVRQRGRPTHLQDHPVL